MISFRKIWGTFSLKTVTKLASVRDMGLPLRSDADLLTVEKWIHGFLVGRCVICECSRVN